MFLLIIIYLAFISLGLPDSVLGSAWPVMHEYFKVGLSDVATVSLIISLMTIISSLNADRLIIKFGTGKLTFISVLITAISLFGFSLTKTYWGLCLWAIPYGLGAGAVDSGLNNYVALHYKSKHMSWLHCFWGVGATLGPYIMGLCLINDYSFKLGYRIIGILQIILTIVLYYSLSHWKKTESKKDEIKVLSKKEALSLKGAKSIMFAFMSYCAIEASGGLWASSYLTDIKGIDPKVAASFGALFYLGITVGRFISGFISDKLGDDNMIRLGEMIILVGIIFLFISFNQTLGLIGLIIIGLGCAPIYPSIIHSTPNRFGKENSQSLVGIQMAFAYVGSMLFPKFLGIISKYLSLKVYPLFLLVLIIVLIISSEYSSRVSKKKNV